jgi:hypothetical protein
VLRLRAGRWEPVPVRARTFYGRRAVWGGLIAVGRDLYAFGGRSGGAHGNTRWSAWAGHSALEEEPQTFETFGGPRAGGLSDVAAAGHRPVLLGSRLGADDAGLDVAVWTRSAPRWDRHDSAGTPLAADDDVQPSAHALVARGPGLLAAGSLTELSASPRMVPAIWTAPAPEGPWTRVVLPGARGPVGEAYAAACGPGGSCLVVGTDDGHLRGWEVSPDGDVTDAHLPSATVEQVVVASAGPGEYAVAAAQDGETRLLLGRADRWRAVTGPAGAATALAVVDGSVWAVTSDGLWSAARP